MTKSIYRGFDKLEVERLKVGLNRELQSKRKTPYDLMLEYKQAVIDENYEKCQAITDVLKPLNYNTADTHSHIKQIN